MLYVCVPSRNHGDTIGLLLWKVRQVFAAFPREYQFLVAADGSTDTTRELLDLYERALPLTVLRQREPQGHGASEALARDEAGPARAGESGGIEGAHVDGTGRESLSVHRTLCS